MVKWTYRTLKEQNLPGTLPPELNRLHYLQIMYVVISHTFPLIQIKILLTLFYIFYHMYQYINLHDKLFCPLYYSDLSRNYLNGTIPKEWGSMTNLLNMYDVSPIFLFLFLIIDCFYVSIYSKILTYGFYFTFFTRLYIHFLVDL
jgi:hypothetical protein